MLAILIFLHFFSRESPPDFIFKFMIYGFALAYFGVILVCILRRLLYKIVITYCVTNGFEVIERCIKLSKYSFQTASQLKLVIPTTLMHRLPFIRISNDYSKEFGGLLGIHQLKEIIRKVEEVTYEKASLEVQLMIPRLNENDEPK